MSSMEGLNTFQGGMDSDISKLFQKPESYIEAYNFRPVTTLGSSNYSLTNIKGNQYIFNIRDTYPVYRIQVNETATGVSGTTISIQGNSTAPIYINNTYTGYQLFGILSNLPGYNNNFYLAYDDNYIVIWSETSDPLVQLSATSDINFVTQNGSPYYVEPQADLEPIGSTFIRDDIYIYTTNNDSLNPISAGQIWKLSHDSSNNTNSLKLIYNNYVNFSKQYGISPTATLGRYENDGIQRIYWTDFYNKLRQANVANPNLMALSVNLLSIFPTTNFFVPTLQKVNVTGGAIKTGIYQFAYQLVKANGQITFWSPLSNLVGIYNRQSDLAFTNGNNFYSYIGNSSLDTTTKSVELLINNLDQEYDFVNLAVVKRYTNNDPGTVEIFSTNEPIPTSGSLKFTYTQLEPITTISLEELLQNNFGFTHCKTIATKDNRLFVGNVKNELEDINYDSRAYQYPISSGSTTLINNGITGTYTSSNLATPFYFPETADTINANTTFNKYQAGSNVPGGTGPNISYTFGTHCLKVDEIPYADFNSVPMDSPWRQVNQLYDYVNNIDNVGINFGIEDENYPFHYINDSMKSTYKSTLLKGYRHNEIYRFGIQFYDKESKPYFVKWIGDIKFPDYNDFNPNNGYIDNNITSPYNDFRPIFLANNKAYMNILYVQFTVNIPNNIKDLISGFEIVRVERTDNDKSILASGILYQTRSDGAANLYLPNTGNNNARTTNGIGGLALDNEALNIDLDDRSVSGAGSQYDFTFEYFDWNVQGIFPGFDSNSDRLVIKGKIGSSSSNLGFTVDGCVTASPGNGYYYNKFYDWIDYHNDSYNLLDGRFMVRNDNYTSPYNSGWGYTNRDNTSSGPLIRCEGIDTFYIITEQPLFYNGNYGCSSSNQQKLYFEYTRERPNQYGGNTYSARSNSEYIGCQGFIPIEDNSIVTSGSIRFSIFAGDVFYGIQQNQKGLKNSGNSDPDERESYIHYKPSISSYNVELRAGVYFDYNNGSTISQCNFSEETFNYNNTYNVENNIRKFFPKPVIFNETDKWDNRVYYSEIKVNGETIDNWTRFLIGNYWDVEGSYGGITSLISLQDKMYFVQNNGFGVLYINPIALTNTNNGLPLTLGTGAVIQRHDYVNIDCGTILQWSVYSSPNSIVFVDTFRKKIFRYTGQLESITDINGQIGNMNRFINGNIITVDKPVLKNGITSFYDNLNNEFIFVFQNINGQVQEHNTIVFNEVTGKFTSFYSFNPKIHITNHKDYWTTDPNNPNQLYLHNYGNYGEFYGIKFDSTIKLNSNHNSQYTKIFNNIVLLTESIQDNDIYNQYDDVNIYNDTFYQIRIYNDYQNTDYLPLDISNRTIRRLERSWNIQVPRNKVLYSTGPSPNIFNDIGNKSFGERIRDKYGIIDLSYSNSNNYRFIFHSLKTQYLISDR